MAAYTLMAKLIPRHVSKLAPTVRYQPHVPKPNERTATA